LDMLCGGSDLRHHGATDGRSWWWPADAMLGCAGCVTAEWNGLDVHADERLPFEALAEADLEPAKRCPPVLVRRWPKRTQSRIKSFHTRNGSMRALNCSRRQSLRRTRRDQRCQRGRRQTHLTDDALAGCGPATSASRFWKCQRGTSRCLPLADAFDSLQYVTGSAVASARAAAVISESI
jgi:hypothetical protein